MPMHRSRFLNEQYRTKRIALVLFLVLFGAVFVYSLSNWSEKKALLEAEEKAQNILTYQSSNLISHLNKFSLITALVSRRPYVLNMFRLRELGVHVDDARQLATITAGLSGAKDFWFVDRHGDIFSSSNLNMVGRNVKDESYFEAGMQGRLGRASAVEGGFRSYIFASPVFFKEGIAGIVVVRVDLEVVEYVWALLKEPIVATEANGRILLSNIEDWRLQKLSPLVRSEQSLSSLVGEEKLRDHRVDQGQLIESQVDQYTGDTAVSEDSQGESKALVNPSFIDRDAQKIQLVDPLPGKNSTQYLEVTTHVPLLQWKLHVMVDMAPVKQQRLITTVISSLMIVLLILLVLILFERRRRLMERARDQRAFSLRLERQVRDRTHELTATNTMLEIEVAERRAAEKALRETQQDLVQAAKLAGIGQMSAALAHEYNQPLAAIRSYADNAVQLLDLAKEDDVKANLGRITAITERMADLTKTLRSFARKSEVVREPVALSAIVDEMVILLSPQAKKQGVELNIYPPEKPIVAVAGQLRLSQVVINLVTNAMDAVKDADKKCVDVSWREHNGCAEFFVKDSGQGIPDDVKDKIFTPFFTTKGVGTGLGLGLFIVYNMVKEFQGTIEVREESGYGAVFYMTLPLSDDVESVAVASQSL